MDRWTDLVLAHKRLVVLAWVLVAAAGAALAPATVSSLSYSFALPGQPAYQANQAITRASGGGGVDDPIAVVATPRQGSLADPALARAFTEAVDDLAAAVHGTRVVAPSASPVLTGRNGTTGVALLYPPTVPGAASYAAALPRLQAAADRIDAAGGVGGAPLVLTGPAVLHDSSSGSDRSVLFETLLGGLGALVVLVLVFASLLAGVPLLVAVVSILATFLCLFALTRVTEVSFVVQYLVALIGLGVAIDYSLLIVMRWREERSRATTSRDPADTYPVTNPATSNEAAVRTAMATAGRSVLFSGITVAVSLAALVTVPLPFLRSIGLGGLLIPLASVATATTLVPVVLATIGPRLQWPGRRPTDPASRTWARIATAVVRRPAVTAAASTVALLALASPLLGLHLGSPTLNTYNATTPAGAAAARATNSGIPAGVLRPLEVLLPPDTSADAEATSTAVNQLAAVPGVAAAVAPTGPGWATHAGRLVQVWTADDPATTTGAATVSAVRLRLASAHLPGTGGVIGVGGSPAEDADFVTAVYSDAPWVAVGIVAVTLLLLARALRSLWLPLKALLLNMVSLAAYGITVAIWQHGLGTRLLFGAPASGAITTWVPVAVFAFLFGLSMDYEVFILSRMREAHDDGADTPAAVVTGIAHTGRLVTSAALILFLAFIALSTVPAVEVKILATALALGIAIDALIVRALLAPALVVLLGHLNWTLPQPLAGLLRIPQAPQAPPQQAHGPAGL